MTPLKFTENLPIIISLIVLTASFGYTLNGLQLETNDLVKDTRSALHDFNNHLNEKLEHELFMVENLMMNQWINTKNESNLFKYSRYLEIVPTYYNVSRIILAINWINTSGFIKWVYPYERNKGAVNKSVIHFSDGEFNEAFNHSRSTNKTEISHIIPLFQGGEGIATYIPIIDNNTITGYFNLVFEISKLLNYVTSHLASLNRFSFIISEENRNIPSTNENFSLSDTFVVAQNLTFYNREWVVYSRPIEVEIFKTTPFSQVGIFTFEIIFCIVIYILTSMLKKKNDIIQKEFEEKEKLLENQYRDKQIKALGTLAGGIAHDFNNLLTNIAGHVQLIELNMKDEENDRPEAITSDTLDKIEYSLQTISKNIKRSKDLTNQILTVSRSARVNFQIIDLNKTIFESISLIKETTDKRIEFLPWLQGNLFVYADLTQLLQIFMNILLNSVHAVDINNAQIKITARRSLRDYDVSLLKNIKQEKDQISFLKKGCIITIRDNGRGMTKTQISKAFDPFYTTSTNGKGTGLGLVIVHNNVMSFGGIVTLESEFNKFTNVEIQLPLVKVPENYTQPGKEDKLQKTEINIQGLKLIFIIDDEPDIIDAYEQILEKNGFKVLSTSNSIHAFSIYKIYFKQIDLVLLDINMPGLNGIDLIKLIREIKPNQKFIVMTGFSEHALNVPENIPIIQKPFSINALLDLFKNILA